MSIEFDCPQCQRHFRLDDDRAGLSGRCPDCKRPYKVPSPSNLNAVAIGPESPAPSPMLPQPLRQEVTIIDVDIPFARLVGLSFRLWVAGLPLAFTVAVLFFLLVRLLARS